MAAIIEQPQTAGVGEDRKELLMTLYKNAFPSVARYISKMNGSLEEAQDVFQDALVIFFEKMSREELSVEGSAKAYLLGIVRHLWSKRHKLQSKTIRLEDSELSLLTEKDSDKIPLKGKLKKFLETTGKKCMEMLQAFYYEEVPLNQLALRFGFSSVRSATVQKYKCLEKVRNSIKEKSLHYEDFFE